MNTYEIEAGTVLFAGETVWSMPECFRGFTTRQCINACYLHICGPTTSVQVNKISVFTFQLSAYLVQQNNHNGSSICRFYTPNNNVTV